MTAVSARPPADGSAAVEALLADDTVEEIWVNAPDRIFVSRQGLR